jgi:hypothetical protein
MFFVRQRCAKRVGKRGYEGMMQPSQPRLTRVVINARCCELLVNTTPHLLRLLPAQPPQDRVCLDCG